jgi:hypothetical protein
MNLRAVTFTLTITFSLLWHAGISISPAASQAQTGQAKGQEEPNVIPLLSGETGMMLLTKAKWGGTQFIAGSLAGKAGAPLAGKTLCLRVRADSGELGVIAEISEAGQMNALLASSSAQGAFSFKAPRFEEYVVGVCSGKGIAIKMDKELKTFKSEEAKPRIDLGKLVIE